MPSHLGSFLQLPPAVQVEIIIDQDQLYNCVGSLRNEPIVGLDAEWCPQTKELSLLQIATSTRHVVSSLLAIAQLARLGKVFPGVRLHGQTRSVLKQHQGVSC
jgi:hypothetical protein